MTQYVNLEQENSSFKESNGQLESELQKCYENIHDLSIKLPKSEKEKGEALKEDLRQIRSYLPEVLWHMRSYLLEPYLSCAVLNRPMQSYLVFYYAVMVLYCHVRSCKVL